MDQDLNALFGNQTFDIADVIVKLSASDSAFGREIKSKINKLVSNLEIKNPSRKTTESPSPAKNQFFDEGPQEVEIVDIDKKILDKLMKGKTDNKPFEVKEKKGNFLGDMLKNLLGLGAGVGLGGMLSGLLGGLFNIPGKILGSIKKFGPLGLLAGGLILAAMDAIKAIAMADKWGTSKVSAGIGGFLAGNGSGSIKDMFKNAGKLAMIGIGIGSAFGPLGMLVGGILGAVIGAVAAAIGAEKLAKSFDVFGKKIKDWTKQFIGVLGELWTSLKNAFGPIWEKTIVPTLQAIGDFVINTIMGIFTLIGSVLTSIFGSIDYKKIITEVGITLQAMGDVFIYLFNIGKEQFKKFEEAIKAFPFKQVIDDTIKAVAAIFTWFDLNLFQPLFGSTEEIKKKNLKENVDAAKREINGWGEIFKDLWTDVKLFGTMLSETYEKSFKPFFIVVKEVLDVTVGYLLREQLIPMFKGMMKWFRDELMPAVRGFIEPIMKDFLPPLIKIGGYFMDFIFWVGKMLAPIIGKLVINISNKLYPAVKWFGGLIGDMITNTLKAFGSLTKWIGKTLQFFIDGGKALGEGLSDLADWFSKLPKMIKDITDKIKRWFGKETEKTIDENLSAGERAKAMRKREKYENEQAQKPSSKYAKTILGETWADREERASRENNIKQDFVMRPGNKAQSFSDKDTLYGIKEGGPLEKVLSKSFEKLDKSNDQSDKHLQELKNVMIKIGDKLDYIAQINIKMVQSSSAPKQASQPLPSITEGNGREPAYDNAYNFRTKVWEVLHGVT